MGNPAMGSLLEVVRGKPVIFFTNEGREEVPCFAGDPAKFTSILVAATESGRCARG